MLLVIEILEHYVGVEAELLKVKVRVGGLLALLAAARLGGGQAGVVGQSVFQRDDLQVQGQNILNSNNVEQVQGVHRAAHFLQEFLHSF